MKLNKTLKSLHYLTDKNYAYYLIIILISTWLIKIFRPISAKKYLRIENLKNTT